MCNYNRFRLFKECAYWWALYRHFPSSISWSLSMFIFLYRPFPSLLLRSLSSTQEAPFPSGCVHAHPHVWVILWIYIKFMRGNNIFAFLIVICLLTWLSHLCTFMMIFNFTLLCSHIKPHCGYVQHPLFPPTCLKTPRLTPSLLL